jgi:hypothetical protein
MAMKTVPAVLALLFCCLFASPVSAAALTVSAGTVNGGPGSTVTIPVNVENAKDLGSMDIVISYDPSVLSAVSVDKGSLNKGMISSTTDMPGIISLGIVDADGINGNGAVAEITMKVTGADGASSTLSIDRVLAYDARTHLDIQTVTGSGTFTVKQGGPGAALPETIALVAVAAIGLLSRRGKSG